MIHNFLISVKFEMIHDKKSLKNQQNTENGVKYLQEILEVKIGLEFITMINKEEKMIEDLDGMDSQAFKDRNEGLEQVYHRIRSNFGEYHFIFRIWKWNFIMLYELQIDTKNSSSHVQSCKYRPVYKINTFFEEFVLHEVKIQPNSHKLLIRIYGNDQNIVFFTDVYEIDMRTYKLLKN